MSRGRPSTLMSMTCPAGSLPGAVRGPSPLVRRVVYPEPELAVRESVVTGVSKRVERRSDSSGASDDHTEARSVAACGTDDCAE